MEIITRATERNADSFRIAVLIPCHNEAAAIDKVVRDFRAALPEAAICVCDNNSTDGSADLAKHAGAIVSRETLPGKGNVVRRMFSDIEASVYLLVDGDDTYDAGSARKLVECLVGDGLDMVVGTRAATSSDAYRRGHRFGNYALTKIVRLIFGDRISDMLSGYRVFSRRFVKSFPALTQGFEIETELTIHALELRMPIAEVATSYRERPPESRSKLNTFRDGWKILKTILTLVKEERPLRFFAFIGAVLAGVALILAWPIFVEFSISGQVPRFPTAILCTGLMILAFLSLACGAVLDTVTRGRQEMKRLAYLAVPGLSAARPVTQRSSGRDSPAVALGS